jgi:serine/threonine-protein kinase
MMRPTDPRQLAQGRVGQTLGGKWVVDRLVDMGGMAAVYAVTHRTTGKRAAIKLLMPAFAANKEVRDRFLREGYVANKVDHPGSVSVFDDGMTEDGAPFLVMELLEGESLEEWIGRSGGRLKVADVLAVAEQTLDVLSAAHGKGIVHRDIKPGNLFAARDGRIKVLDFGLARLRDPKLNAMPTAGGIVLGTSAYMPPEQAQGKSHLIDGRSDIYAVGAVMFRALTGRYVHNYDNAQERLIAAMRERAPSLGSVVPHAPASIIAVVDRALAFDMGDRWPDAATMRFVVRQVYDELANKKPESMAPVSVQVTVEESIVFDVQDHSSIVVDVSFGGEGSALPLTKKQG